MKFFFRKLFLSGLSCTLFFGGVLGAADYVPGKIIVKFKSTRDLRVLGDNAVVVQSFSGVDARLRQAGARQGRYTFPLQVQNQRRGLFTQSLAEKFPLRAARAPAGIQVPDLATIVVFDIDPAVEVSALATELKDDPAVEWAEPNYKIQLHYTPNDPYMSSSGSWGQSYRDQWGPIAIKTPEAYEFASAYEANTTVIGIMDTGVEYYHTDVSLNIWINSDETSGDNTDNDSNGYVDDLYGFNFDDVTGDAIDGTFSYSGHGTHVAGIAAARGNNGQYMCGVSPTSQVMVLNVFGSNGGSLTTIASALDYAVANGADVVNMSLGITVSSNAMNTSIASAAAAGLVMVVSVGNGGADGIGDNLDLSGGDNDDYPAESDAGIDQIIGVGSLETSLARSDFSNYGDAVDLTAPGRDILSLRSSRTSPATSVGDGKLGRLSGTSMAAPHVAGVAALMLQVNPSLTYSALKHRIYRSATDLGSSGRDVEYGYGMVNAYLAVLMSDPIRPTINHTPITVYDTATPMTVTADISDNFDFGDLSDLLPSANLYYRFVENNTTPVTDWLSVDAQVIGSFSVQAIIPTPSFTVSDIWYYWQARDYNPSNDITTPSTAPSNYFTTLLNDVSGPSINYNLNAGDHVSLYRSQEISVIDNVQTVTASLQIAITDIFGNTLTYDITSNLVTYNAQRTLTYNWPSSDYYNLPGEYRLRVYAEDISANASAFNITVNMTTLSDVQSSFAIFGPSGPGSAVLTYPNPFNLDIESATFAYQITDAASMVIRIYGLNRRLLRSLSYSKGSMGYYNVDTWDGKDDNGTRLPNGTYPFTITATSSGGEVARARGKMIMLR